jgi:hypothetical protein
MSNKSIESNIINSLFKKRDEKIRSKSARKSALTSDQLARRCRRHKHQQKKRKRNITLQKMRKQKCSVANQESLIIPLNVRVKEIEDNIKEIEKHNALEKEILMAKFKRVCDEFMMCKKKLKEVKDCTKIIDDQNALEKEILIDCCEHEYDKYMMRKKKFEDCTKENDDHYTLEKEILIVSCEHECDKFMMCKNKLEEIENQERFIARLKETEDALVDDMEKYIKRIFSFIRVYKKKLEEIEEIKIENQMMFITRAGEIEFTLMTDNEKCIKRKKRKRHSAKYINPKVRAYHIEHRKNRQRRNKQRATKLAVQHT